MQFPIKYNLDGAAFQQICEDGEAHTMLEEDFRLTKRTLRLALIGSLLRHRDGHSTAE